MRQVEFKNHKGEDFLFVKLHDAEYSYLAIHDMAQGNILVGSTRFLGYTKTNILLPKGNWQLIAPLSEMTEELWKGVVKNPFVVTNFFNPKEVSFSWWDYNDDFWSSEIKSATESGESLLKSLQIYMVNPYGACPDNKGLDSFTDSLYLDDMENEWQQAEENTGNYVLIQKIK